MKTKNLSIIFSLFLLIALASASVVLLTQEKNQPVVNELPNVVERPAESAKVTSAALKQNTTPLASLVRGAKKVATSTEEKINAVIIINGVKYDTAVKPGGSVYDLMNELKTQNKINFSGKNYSGLGFFVEEINGVRNNPAGENWLYYVNGSPAQVGISYYLIKSNDIIEWKYEKKSF